MADNKLNQIALDVLRQANGDAGPSPDAQTPAQDLLPPSWDSLSSALRDAARQTDALRSANQFLAEAVRSNTQAVNQNSVAQSKGAGATFKSIASGILDSALGLAPLATSLGRLFGAGKSE